MTDYEGILKPLFVQAKLAGACEKFKGTETLPELMKLFKSPQGIEFCTKYHFPNMATCRMLAKVSDLSRFGIYVDAGVITLEEPRNVVLVGRTTANINCKGAEYLCKVAVLHGAKAIINANGWSVVYVKVEQGSTLVRNVSDNAVII